MFQKEETKKPKISLRETFRAFKHLKRRDWVNILKDTFNDVTCFRKDPKTARKELAILLTAIFAPIPGVLTPGYIIYRIGKYQAKMAANDNRSCPIAPAIENKPKPCCGRKPIGPSPCG